MATPKEAGPFSYIREPIDQDVLDRLIRDEKHLEEYKDRMYVVLSDGVGSPALLAMRIEASKGLIRQLIPGIKI